MSDLVEKATLLRALHVPGVPLVLPNVCDVGSALTVVTAGFPVVATTSNAIAATLGYDDGERAPVSKMVHVAKRIASVASGLARVPEQGGNPLISSSFWQHDFQPARSSAGLACGVHDLRHTSVALAIAEGAHPKAIQTRMGHSSINVTLDRYGHQFPPSSTRRSLRASACDSRRCGDCVPGMAIVRPR